MIGLVTPEKREAFTSSIALFTSLSTLVCCALPAMLVALGAGAVMAGLVTAVPQLVWLSRHKTAVFVMAGLMLFAAIWARYAYRGTCPIDPKQAAACARLGKFGGVTLAVSMSVYVVAFFFAFIAPLVAD